MHESAPNSHPRTQEELHKEIAILIAEGFLVFHPTNPIYFSIENAVAQWYQQPDTTLVDQILLNCKAQIEELAKGIL